MKKIESYITKTKKPTCSGSGYTPRERVTFYGNDMWWGYFSMIKLARRQKARETDDLYRVVGFTKNDGGS